MRNRILAAWGAVTLLMVIVLWPSGPAAAQVPLLLWRHLDRPGRPGDHDGPRSASPDLERRSRVGAPAAASPPA